MKTVSLFLNKSTLVVLLLITIVQLTATSQTGTSSQTIYSNMALGKTANASSSFDAVHSASNAFDGNQNTRYTSDYNENQWLSVDMGKNYFLNSIVINWEKSYGKDFDVLFSMDGSFTDLPADSLQVRNHIFTQNKPVNTDSLATKPNTVARYVRIHGLHSATGNGYSVWEVMVMGTTAISGLFPVSVTSFTASAANNSNLLDWTTNTEFSSAGFSIERSTDAMNFSTIGWVSAQNLGTVISHYSFTDKQASPGKNYYRLKQIWLDGKSGYSAVIILNISGAINTINTYPVPVKDHLSVEYRGTAGETISITLFNTGGMPVYSSKMLLRGSQQTIIINRTGNMNPGQYFLNISGANSKSYNEKIILQ